MIVALCRIAVGAVLLVSGTAKLRQPAWPATAREFGTPGWLLLLSIGLMDAVV